MRSCGNGARCERHRVDQSECNQPDAECHKHEAEITSQLEREPTPADSDRQARKVGEHRPAQVPEALECEVESQPQAKECVEWTHGLHVRSAGGEHRRIVIEQAEPGSRVGRGDRSDECTHGRRHKRADPRHSHCTIVLAGADIGPHQRYKRSAQSEDERDQEVLQSRSDAVAGDGGRTKGPDQARHTGYRHVGANRHQG